LSQFLRLKLFKIISLTSFVFVPLASIEADEYKFEEIKFDQVKYSQNSYQPQDKLDEYIINGATYSTKFVPLMNDGSDGSDYTELMGEDAKRLLVDKGFNFINSTTNNQIQKIKNFKTQNFLKKKFNLSNYSKAKILKESYLFLDWYLPANKLIIQKGYKKKKLKIIIDNLYLNLKIKQKVFVHRDFHVSNMMFYKNKIALIDSQDAVLGNPAYDLASLIDDVRIKTSNSFKSNILKVFLSKFKYKNESQFINDFEILSVLRNLKIIGIFTRLANRDKKKKYLKLIPYAWKLIDNRLKNNSNFNDLINFLKENPKIKKNEN